MPSPALIAWRGHRSARLDELEQVHGQLTGSAPGRRWLTEQLDRAYVLMLASQFQGYCRDVHSDPAARVAATAPASARAVFEGNLTLRRNLDHGNPNAGNLGNDFGRLGFDFWTALYQADHRNRRRREFLDQVMIWRNAIAHDSRISVNDEPKIAGTKPTLTQGRNWRRGLGALVASIDEVTGDAVAGLTSIQPW